MGVTQVGTGLEQLLPVMMQLGEAFGKQIFAQHNSIRDFQERLANNPALREQLSVEVGEALRAQQSPAPQARPQVGEARPGTSEAVDAAFAPTTERTQPDPRQALSGVAAAYGLRPDPRVLEMLETIGRTTPVPFSRRVDIAMGSEPGAVEEAVRSQRTVARRNTVVGEADITEAENRQALASAVQALGLPKKQAEAQSVQIDVAARQAGLQLQTITDMTNWVATSASPQERAEFSMGMTNPEYLQHRDRQAQLALQRAELALRRDEMSLRQAGATGTMSLEDIMGAQLKLREDERATLRQLRDANPNEVAALTQRLRENAATQAELGMAQVSYSQQHGAITGRARSGVDVAVGPGRADFATFLQNVQTYVDPMNHRNAAGGEMGTVTERLAATRRTAAWRQLNGEQQKAAENYIRTVFGDRLTVEESIGRRSRADREAEDRRTREPTRQRILTDPYGNRIQR